MGAADAADRKRVRAAVQLGFGIKVAETEFEMSFKFLNTMESFFRGT